MRWTRIRYLLLWPWTLSQAFGWRNENSVEARLIDLQLTADNPDFSRQDQINAWEGRLRLIEDGPLRQDQYELGIGYGTSLLSGRSYETASARSSLSFRDAHSSDTWSAGALFNHGADPVNQPLEESAGADPSDFSSFQVGYGHQRELSARDGLRFELGLTRNHQGKLTLLTEELALAYLYKPERRWNTSWRLRLSQQEARDVDPNRLAEFNNDHLWQLNAAFAVEAGIGYSAQRQGDVSGSGLLYLAAVNFVSQNEEETEADPIKGKAKAKQKPDLKGKEGLKGATTLRVGATRSREQRRIGDPVFVADQIFFTGGFSLGATQGVQLDLRQSHAPEGPQKGFRESTATLAYRYRHEYSSRVKGQFGAEVSDQTTENTGRTLERQLLTLLYGLSF